jgi:hypothetical protein
VKRKEKEKEGKEERGGRGTGWFRFVAGLDWAPGTAQAGLLAFSFFLCYFFSYFRFSYFFHRFCILNPNQAKPIS